MANLHQSATKKHADSNLSLPDNFFPHCDTTYNPTTTFPTIIYTHTLAATAHTRDLERCSGRCRLVTIHAEARKDLSTGLEDGGFNGQNPVLPGDSFFDVFPELREDQEEI